jgi:hypothetical protein
MKNVYPFFLLTPFFLQLRSLAIYAKWWWRTSMVRCQNKKHPMWLCNTILSISIQPVAVIYYSQVKPHHVASHTQKCNAYGNKLLLLSGKPSPGAGAIILTANVFPEPVWAIPTMSRPLMAIGQPWHWIAVGDSNPDFLQNTFSSAGWRPEQT